MEGVKEENYEFALKAAQLEEFEVKSCFQELSNFFDKGLRELRVP